MKVLITRVEFAMGERSMKGIIVAMMALCLIVLDGCGSKTEEQQGVQGEEVSQVHGNTISLSKDQLSYIDLKTEVVEMRPLPITLTFPGKVVLNDRRVAHISARVNGRVEKVNAVIGDRVGNGDVLIELYSQEFLAMQSEFTQAEERLKRTPDSSPEHGTSEAIYNSARSKLSVLGVADYELTRLENDHIPQPYLLVRTPFQGTVLAANARIGEFVQLGSELYTVADLTTLWVVADIYEKDLHLVRPGMTATVAVSAHPSMKFHGTFAALYDVVDEKTRAVKARIEVNNPSRLLKPEMFATIEIFSRGGTPKLIISSSSLLGETDRQYVFVATNDTTFERRDVRVRAMSGEFAEISSGLVKGDRVVVQGGFFLKSELGKSALGEE